MSLSAGCPRCAAPVVSTPDGWVCVEHAEITPLWRPAEVSYDEFAAHLGAAVDFPTYLPWPLGPGWSVSDFACVADVDRPSGTGRVCATLTCASGTSALDGPVDVMVVTEEAGTGLGSRVAGTAHDDPGHEIRHGAPTVRVRIGSQVVPLWPVSTSGAAGEWDRSVVAGEAHGRWLWLVLRPASAVLLLRDDWILKDVAASGPHLVELPFGGPAPAW